MITLFSYGSILLPRMTISSFDTVFAPLKSVFIRGHKIVIQHAKSKIHPQYHYLIAESTANDDDIIPGFLVNIPEEIIERLDAWEGDSYERKDIICFDRNLQEIGCQIYTGKE